MGELLGAITGGAQALNGMGNFKFTTGGYAINVATDNSETSMRGGLSGIAGQVNFYGKDHATYPGGVRIQTTVAAGASATERLKIVGDAAVVVATWSNITHTGIVLSGLLACGGQQLKNAQFLELDEIATPSALADHAKLYTKSTNKFFFQDGAGVEHEMTKEADFANHSARHEHTGGDEMSVAGLSGQLADDQHVVDAEVTAAVNAAGVALASGKSIELEEALSSNDTASGFIITNTHGESVLFGRALYMKDDAKWWLADKDSATTMPAAALALLDDLDEGVCEMLLIGFARQDNWDWTPGGLLYVGDAGAITDDVSGYTTGDQVQVVGVAISADIIYFNPSLELVEIA